MARQYTKRGGKDYRRMTPAERAAYMREYRKTHPKSQKRKDRGPLKIQKPQGVAGSAYVKEDWAAYMREYMRWRRDAKKQQGEANV